MKTLDATNIKIYAIKFDFHLALYHFFNLNCKQKISGGEGGVYFLEIKCTSIPILSKDLDILLCALKHCSVDILIK